MFTGLVKDIGVIESVVPNTEGKLITVQSNLCDQIAIDDSVSINGACQTVVNFNHKTFTVQAVGTTLEKTNLSSLKSGELVNLELALRLSDRLGGHLVQGHVNGLSEVAKIASYGDNYVVTLKVAVELRGYIVKEGSITLNGISLTVSDVDKMGQIQVSVIPHTWFHTNLKNIHIGDKINVEVDIIAKYVENLMKYQDKNNKNVTKTLITEKWLAEQGY
jgi:riboflavin synthase